MITLDCIILGPSIDVGLAMSAKIIKGNGQVLHRSIHQPLTQEELDRKECKAKCRSFMESLHQKLCSQATMDDLVDLGAEDMPQYDPYEDEAKN